MTETKPPSKIRCTIDLSASGAHHGHLIIPHSRDESPWGSLMVPISSFKAADGPVALLTGGNHGDEYEGILSLVKLIQELDPTTINGQIIILPALNYPAVKAGKRLSPLDGGNMNRSFPGDPNGSITQMIADFVYRFLLPMANIVIDVHSGGSLMSFLPTSVIHQLDDPKQMQKTIAAAKAFAAPNCLVLEELDSVGLLDTAVEALGKIFISTELGGGGFSTPETQLIADEGIRSCLAHMGILNASFKKKSQTRFLTTPSNAYVVAEQDGLFEFACELGAKLKKGEELAFIYDIDAPTEAPKVYTAPCDGIVIHRHLSGLIKRGDCLAVMGAETTLFS
ncbi:succinylglutamate desuccinylase/aspartoacylase domain-containing protein [Sneathiella glossodoripedis]|uniref:succinylglutamate desuccinylase/aspartoacylase domain-containing protein n=1 Tax=Sneathiella glossodoripedis TaxID=418853 RepID=UPI0004712276|nr:succinylglutamate desuccinylase/aspartoacylase family protein [Sneathiella glossodoripedis]